MSNSHETLHEEALADQGVYAEKQAWTKLSIRKYQSQRIFCSGVSWLLGILGAIMAVINFFYRWKNDLGFLILPEKCDASAILFVSNFTGMSWLVIALLLGNVSSYFLEYLHKSTKADLDKLRDVVIEKGRQRLGL